MSHEIKLPPVRGEVRRESYRAEDFFRLAIPPAKSKNMTQFHARAIV